MASGYSKTALAVLLITLARNLKKDFKQHRSFQEQVDYWVKLVKDHQLDPDVDDFASSIMALDGLYRRHKAEIDGMHQQIASVLTKLADPNETGGFRWSNCDFVVFQDILEIAERTELGALSLGEVIAATKRSGDYPDKTPGAPRA